MLYYLELYTQIIPAYIYHRLYRLQYIKQSIGYRHKGYKVKFIPSNALLLVGKQLFFYHDLFSRIHLNTNIAIAAF